MINAHGKILRVQLLFRDRPGRRLTIDRVPGLDVLIHATLAVEPSADADHEGTPFLIILLPSTYDLSNAREPSVIYADGLDRVCLLDPRLIEIRKRRVFSFSQVISVH